MFRKNKKLLIYFLIFVLPFSFLFFQPSLFSPLELDIAKHVSLPVRIALFPLMEAKKILFYHVTYDHYKRLKKENELLKSQLLKWQEANLENTHLKSLLDFKKNSSYSLVAAKVIGRDPSGWTSAIIVDKGQQDGIKRGMPVISSLGIVGKVLEVGKTASKIILLNDPSFAVAGVAERSREAGLVLGTLQGICRMRYLSAQADIKVGDRIVTSSLSSFFPEGLFIGEVISVSESQSSPTLECLIKPAVSPSTVEEVLIKK